MEGGGGLGGGGGGWGLGSCQNLELNSKLVIDPIVTCSIAKK